MKAVLTEKINAGPSLCDKSGNLSTQAFFTLFSDIATQHAGVLGIGLDDMLPKKLFWIAVKTKIRIISRPRMCSRLELTTWPEKPERLRCYRNYVLRNDKGEICAEGKTEWVVLNLETGKPQSAIGVFPEDIEYCEESNDVGAFSRIKDEGFETLIGKYRVSGTDIDIGGHMHNAFYVRALLSLMPWQDLEKLNISSFEINYRNPCFEGDELSVYSKTEDGRLILKAADADGKLISTAVIG